MSTFMILQIIFHKERLNIFFSTKVFHLMRYDEICQYKLLL